VTVHFGTDHSRSSRADAALLSPARTEQIAYEPAPSWGPLGPVTVVLSV
jgi:hypothetical protein